MVESHPLKRLKSEPLCIIILSNRIETRRAVPPLRIISEHSSFSDLSARCKLAPLYADHQGDPIKSVIRNHAAVPDTEQTPSGQQGPSAAPMRSVAAFSYFPISCRRGRARVGRWRRGKVKGTKSAGRCTVIQGDRLATSRGRMETDAPGAVYIGGLADVMRPVGRAMLLAERAGRKRSAGSTNKHRSVERDRKEGRGQLAGGSSHVALQGLRFAT